MNAARGFAFHPVRGLSQRQNRDIGLLRRLHRLGDCLIVIGNGPMHLGRWPRRQR